MKYLLIPLLVVAAIFLVTLLVMPANRKQSRRITRQLATARVLAAAFMLGVQEALTLPTRLWSRVRHRNTPIAYAANIAEGIHADALTRLTDAAITTRHLLYKAGSDANHIAVAGAADLPIGAIADEATAAEENLTLLLLGKGPTKRMVASEAITAGEEVYAAASGKVQDLPTAAGTYWRVGTALTAAAADGDVIEVADCVAQKLVIA